MVLANPKYMYIKYMWLWPNRYVCLWAPHDRCLYASKLHRIGVTWIYIYRTKHRNGIC